MKKSDFRLAVFVLSVGLAAPGLAESDQSSLKAVVSWSGYGKMSQTSAAEHSFQGRLDGVMYIETSEGDLNEAFVECMAEQALQRGENLTRLEGQCTIIQSPEDSVYASYTCAGEPGACKGKFTLTGGEGRFKGITGSSPLIMRSPLRHLGYSLTSVDELVVRHGVMVLPDLNYNIPGGR